MDIERTQLKTRDIEALVRKINGVYRQWRAFAGTDDEEV